MSYFQLRDKDYGMTHDTIFFLNAKLKPPKSKSNILVNPEILWSPPRNWWLSKNCKNTMINGEHNFTADATG